MARYRLVAVVIIAPLSRIPVVSSGSAVITSRMFVRSCCRVCVGFLVRVVVLGRSVGGYTCGTRKYCSRSASDRKSSCVRGARDPISGCGPFGKWVGSSSQRRLAKGVVAAGYRLLEPFAVGLADCHVVVVGAVVSVVSASQVVLGLAEAAASSAISLELEVGEAVLEVSHHILLVLAYVEVGCGVLWCGFPCGLLFCTGWIFGRSDSFCSTERYGGSRDAGYCGLEVGLLRGDSGSSGVVVS
jgi:hypothetical protein